MNMGIVDSRRDDTPTFNEVSYETIKKIRNDWGNVKPYTRIELSQKKRKKEKHKKDWSREDYE